MGSISGVRLDLSARKVSVVRSDWVSETSAFSKLVDSCRSLIFSAVRWRKRASRPSARRRLPIIM